MPAGNRHQTLSLLEVDPDLGGGLEPHELEEATRYSVVPVLEVTPPDWDPEPLREVANECWLGLMVVSGLLIRTVHVGKRSATELFGPGDVIRPWDSDGEYAPLPIGLSWRVIEPTRLAVLNDRFAMRMSRWPSVMSDLIGRVARRARLLALSQAVTHLPRIHARVLLLFWLLAERWGRVGPAGVRIDLPLTHELLASLVGTQRPSVSEAVQRLSRAGLLERPRSDQWLLTQLAVKKLGEPESLNLIEAAETAPPPLA